LVETEVGLQLVECAARGVVRLLSHDIHERVAGHQTRKQEVEGHDDEQDDEISRHPGGYRGRRMFVPLCGHGADTVLHTCSVKELSLSSR